MTQHNHSVFVEGCYRCELSRDEREPVDPLAELLDRMDDATADHRGYADSHRAADWLREHRTELLLALSGCHRVDEFGDDLYSFLKEASR